MPSDLKPLSPRFSRAEDQVRHRTAGRPFGRRMGPAGGPKKGGCKDYMAAMGRLKDLIDSSEQK